MAHPEPCSAVVNNPSIFCLLNTRVFATHINVLSGSPTNSYKKNVACILRCMPAIMVKYASVPGNPIWDLQFGVHLVQKWHTIWVMQNTGWNLSWIENALQASNCSSMNKCNMFNSWMARKCSPRCWWFRLRDLCSLPKMRQWQNVKNFFTSVHPISAGVIWFWSSKRESHLMKPSSSWQTLSWWARTKLEFRFALKSAKRLQCRGHSSGL